MYLFIYLSIYLSIYIYIFMSTCDAVCGGTGALWIEYSKGITALLLCITALLLYTLKKKNSKY